MDGSLKGKFWTCVAFAVVCIFLAAPGYHLAPALGDAFMIASGLCFIGAIVLRMNLIRPKYDLSRLREVHERAELRALEETEAVEFDSFVCMGCGETYNMRLPVCPRCKLTQGTPPCR